MIELHRASHRGRIHGIAIADVAEFITITVLLIRIEIPGTVVRTVGFTIRIG